MRAANLNGHGPGIGTCASSYGSGRQILAVYISGGNIFGTGFCAIGKGKNAAATGSFVLKNYLDGVDVFPATIILAGAEANVAISKLTTDISYNYGTNDLQAIDGSLYIYLPQGVNLLEARANNLRFLGLSQLNAKAAFFATAEDGHKVELQINGDYVQWRYEGEDNWHDLVAVSAITGTDGLDGKNAADGQNGADSQDDGREIELRVDNGFIQWHRVGDPTWQDIISLSALQGPAGAEGQPGKDGKEGSDSREIEFQLGSEYIQWRYINEVEWKNLLPLTAISGPAASDGKAGKDGREIELQIDEGFVQWRYLGDENWQNLLPLVDITGPAGSDGQAGQDGREIELQLNANYLQWRYQGDENWQNLLPLTAITGPAGSEGEAGEHTREIELQQKNGYLQYRHQGEENWQNLLSLAELTGPSGTNGTDGQNGADGQNSREIELQKDNGFVQWRYVGDAAWQNLLALEDLTGSEGTNGTDGQDGADGRDSSEIELILEDGYVKWRYQGESEWKNLLLFSELAGADGKDGKDGRDGKDGAPGKMGLQGVSGKAGRDFSSGLKGLAGKSGKNGLPGRDGIDGIDGRDGLDGKDGRGIASLVKTGSDQNIDSYTISYTDGTATEFTITNGLDGPGITSGFLDEENQIILTLTDGRKVNLGKIAATVNLSQIKEGISKDINKKSSRAKSALIISIAALLCHLGWLVPTLLHRRLWP